MIRLVGCCVAVFAASLSASADLPNWTVSWTNDAHTVGLCSNDQNSYVLNVYRDADSAHGGFGLAIGLSDSTKGTAVASVDGLAYLDLRGPISGLDYRAETETNAVWKFSRFGNLCFCPNDGTKLMPAQYITGLHSPGTLVADSSLNMFHIDSGDNPKKTREVIIDEPNVTTSLGGWYLNAVGGLTNLIFRVPKATTWSGPTCHGASGWKTDMGLWDVSGIKYVGSSVKSSTLGTWTGPISSGGTSGATGILRLPSLVNISAGVVADNAAAFFSMGIGEAELGLKGDLVYLATYSFKSCDKLTNVVIGASPAGKTLEICENAFRCNNLKTVYFNGEKPVFSGGADTVSFGTTAPEGYMTFYVRDIPSWADVLAEADANGGFVSAATLRTANRQRVVRYSGVNKVSVELQDPRFADVYHETATVTFSDGREGDYHIGPITLTASCSEPDDAATDPRRSRFLRWDGVPVELERENPLTFTPTKDMVVKAVFAHDWLMSDDAEPNRVMENRFWRVCCWKRTDGDHWIGLGKASDEIGKGSMWPSDPSQRMGGGDLNLNGDIWDSDGQKWTLATVAGMQVWYLSVTNDAGKVTTSCPSIKSLYEDGTAALLPTRLTLPETLKVWPGEVQNYDGWDAAATPWPMKEVIAICPVATGKLSSFTIGGCGFVSRLVIRAPKLSKLGDGREFGITWCGSSFSESSFDEWDLSGVTDVADNALRGSMDYKIKGTLHLPNVQTVGTNAFNRAVAMTGLVLGTNGLVLTSIDDSAFSGAKALTDLTLGTKKLTLGSTLGSASVFAGLKMLSALHLPGPVLPQEQMDAILSQIPESDGAKQTTIYASPLNDWNKLSAALTETELAFAPTNTFGVYRAESRKAWFVVERSPFENQPTFIFFR